VELGERADETLYEEKVKKSKKRKKDNVDGQQKEEKASKGAQFYRISVHDNGCGMKYNQVPDMFGRVLAGSKYVVKQARGKFGLGAKMALIWSKKSTGQPIEITTAHSLSESISPSFVTFCKLDIDIHKNEPNVIKHEKLPNKDGWRGTQVDLIVGGSWSSYKARVLQYMQQLAVITPYAQFGLNFVCEENKKRSFSRNFERRSTAMCEEPKEVKHHPKSIDNVILSQLLSRACERGCQMTLLKFLKTELSCIDASLADRLQSEFIARRKLDPDAVIHCDEVLEKNMIQDLGEMLREAVFPDPKSDCLSPAGEYNLNLGIMKEFNPKLIATSKSKPGIYSGHPFIVEAAVALGLESDKNDNAKPGVQVYRFANRIPLIFEAGSDVANVVARDLKWTDYLIQPSKERIAVFVSIVSTKIPFKDTGKEFIGAEITEIKKAVKTTLQACGQQLKRKVAQQREVSEREGRLKNFEKYVPDVARALTSLLKQMKESQKNSDERGNEKHTEDVKELEKSLLNGKKITKEVIEEKLGVAIRNAAHAQDLEEVKKRGRGEANRTDFVLIPRIPESYKMADPILSHPVIAFRLFSKSEMTSKTMV